MSRAGQVSILGFLFCLGLVAIFWSDLGSTYDKIFAPPLSVADAKCAKLWVPRAQNDPMLACYLKENPARFCNKSERRHLAWLMNRYDSDKSAFGQDMMAAIVAVQINTAIEQAGNPAGDSNDALNKAQKTEADVLRSNGTKDAISVDILPRQELVAMIKALGDQGYIGVGDFGWHPDSLVIEALSGVKAMKSSCPTP